jgi:hypothetical protein
MAPRLLAVLPPQVRVRVSAKIGRGPRGDWRELAQYQERSNRVVREVSWRAYDRFLKANRVDAGVASYDRVTRLVLGTRFQEETRPVAGR